MKDDAYNDIWGARLNLSIYPTSVIDVMLKIVSFDERHR